MLSRQDQPGALIKALRYAHDHTSQVRWNAIESARQVLEATHAFHEPNSADRLVLPTVHRRTELGAPAAPEPTPPHLRPGSRRSPSTALRLPDRSS